MEFLSSKDWCWHGVRLGFYHKSWQNFLKSPKSQTLYKSNNLRTFWSVGGIFPSKDWRGRSCHGVGSGSYHKSWQNSFFPWLPSQLGSLPCIVSQSKSIWQISRYDLPNHWFLKHLYIHETFTKLSAYSTIVKDRGDFSSNCQFWVL